MEKESFVSWSVESDDVYDSEGNVVGSDDYALIGYLYVAPTERKQGVGRKLLREAITEIKESHPSLTIKVAALPFDEGGMDMETLVAFYEREGFSVTDCAGDSVIMEM